ncbi:MAG: globin [Alphaproteobacteria bacterium]|jgi:hemoglobin-like flavoprotein
MDADIILKTIEAVGERCADPVPLVYERLFAAHPDFAPLFRNDHSGAARGHMFNTAIETVMDLVSGDAYATHMLTAERTNHQNLGVASDLFPAFFGATVDAFRDILGPDWTGEAEAAWTGLLGRIDAASAGA